MLSAPDIKFEPPQQKIFMFHDRAVALVAGDPYAQISICNETLRAHQARPRLSIKALADLYADAFSAHRRQIAEARYLKPLGLDANSLMDRSPDFQSENVARLQHDMQREVLEAETIIAGMDDTGPHLFVVTDPGVVSCMDSVAFASIGSGKSHADSYFMMAHHTRNTLFHKALLDTHVAKRRSEVSPTVGSATDLFYISPSGFRSMEQKVHDELEDIRRKLDREIEIAHFEAENEAWSFMLEYTRPPPAEPPPTAPPIPDATAPEDAPPEAEDGSRRQSSRRSRKKSKGAQST
jgi:20S proteasome alpha/beta subunit